ncbi:MAG: LacI family DNA-binding transcriptional regulator [Actinomycetota bacterium]|nr:LacI family DNA-binding transcriptional regulator [Actinomycetota bacterium]
MSEASRADQPARPTMKDVAALAGVAIKTVSRVMNGEPTVAPELASRVRQAAAKLGYRPNLTASSLRRGDRRTATIGLLLEDVANPFSAALLRAVEDVARQRGVQILIGSLDEDPDRERELAITLIDRGVDGLIIVPAATDQSYLLAERKLGIRVVFLDREPRLLDADAVVSANRDGAVEAVEHLLAAGHRRIAYLGDSLRIVTAAQRFDGYVFALDRAGLVADPALIRHELRTTEAAMAATSELISLPEPPTALFASQNLVTIGAVRALRSAGRQHSIALIGFDDFLLADVLDPGVTVVTQDATELGSLATRLLFARLDGDESPPRTHVVPTGMLARGSGEIAPLAAVRAGRR